MAFKRNTFLESFILCVIPESNATGPFCGICVDGTAVKAVQAIESKVRIEDFMVT